MSKLTDDTALALSKVAESAIALAKAEVRLAVAENRDGLMRSCFAGGLAFSSLLCAQVPVLLISLSPVILRYIPWPTLLLSIALSALPALLGFWGAHRLVMRMQKKPAAEAGSCEEAFSTHASNRIPLE
ncbi:MAG: hypothetical protein RJA70_613 [Pseudomonadota bacterium]|jgi:hypothetical protein